MLSRIAAAVVPSLGHLTTTSDEEAAPVTGSIVVANHTSLVDPGIVLAALLRHGVEPVVLATHAASGASRCSARCWCGADTCRSTGAASGRPSPWTRRPPPCGRAVTC